MTFVGQLDEIDTIYLKFYSLYDENRHIGLKEVSEFYNKHKDVIFSLQYYNVASPHGTDEEIKNERLNCPTEIKMLSFQSTSKLLSLGLAKKTMSLATYDQERVDCITSEVVLTSFGKHLLETIESN